MTPGERNPLHARRFRPSDQRDGSLASTTDARSVTVVRTYDAADRVTFVNYPDPTLDKTYTYDDPGEPFSQGRLTAIIRDGLSVDYEYDRFGRTTQDGELTYDYDENGNRTEIGYPGGAVARYTHDFADREATLEFEPAGGSPQPTVESATYNARGPLSSVDLGNGLTETRGHDERYHPARITVAPTGGGAALLDWQYTTDGVGNPTFIDDLLGGVDRDYGYQDVQYYLTQGDGPWGALDWTYDRIGNRLTEVRDGGAADVYGYQQNGALGNTGKLTSILHGVGGMTTFSYDAAGNQTQTNASGVVTEWTYDDANRLSRIDRSLPEAHTDFFYDGRSFLRLAQTQGQDISGAAIFCDGFESGDTSIWGSGPGTCITDQQTLPIYGSEGVVSAKDTAIVLYFAGRPIALIGNGVRYISADHLGAPSLLTGATSAVIWEGGFEPFGGDYAGALFAGMFLRLVGQLDDFGWGGHVQGGLYYNVHRWYESRSGRYTREDPLPLPVLESISPYLYVGSTPSVGTDPLGLCEFRACSDLSNPPPPCTCDKSKIAQAVKSESSLAELFCSYRNSPDCPPGMSCGPGQLDPCDPKVVGNLGGPGGTPQYKPQDDPCLEWCTCQHEQQHHRDLRNPRVAVIFGPNTADQQIINWLECRAYVAGTRCLSGYHIGGIP